MVRAVPAVLALLLACTPAPPRLLPADTPAIAVTIDDLVVGGRDPGLARTTAMTTQIIKHLVEHDVPAVAFVNSDKHSGPERAARLDLLRRWTAAGVELGNHTHSHPSLQTTPLGEFEADVIRGEPDIRELDAASGHSLRYFRHPYLRTGPTPEVRAAFEAFLGARGYTVAPVTIDLSDWLFAFVYADAKTRGDADTMQKVGAAYIAYASEVLTFHEQATRALFGRDIRHILLIHANELAADWLDDLINLHRARGYRFITLEAALADPAYSEPDRYTGDAGMTWLYRWDVTRGRKQVDWSAEPAIPAWVQTAFDAAQRGE